MKIDIAGNIAINITANFYFLEPTVGILWYIILIIQVIQTLVFILFPIWSATFLVKIWPHRSWLENYYAPPAYLWAIDGPRIARRDMSWKYDEYAQEARSSSHIYFRNRKFGSAFMKYHCYKSKDVVKIESTLAPENFKCGWAAYVKESDFSCASPALSRLSVRWICVSEYWTHWQVCHRSATQASTIVESQVLVALILIR